MLQKTKLYQELQKRESSYQDKIKELYSYTTKVLPKINKIFANYTGHGIEHSLNVMQYMYDLVTDISKISSLEITCLIYSALLHDIGMAVNEKEINDIKNDTLNYQGRRYSIIYKKYQDETLALQECIRPAHGERAYRHIMQMQKDFFTMPGFTNCNFQEELAKICQAHTMNHDWILHNLDTNQIKGEDTLNTQYVAMLLRVADYLDIDENRAPIELYRLLSPTGFGDEEWRKHYIIENKEKVVRDHTSGSSIIVMYGQCNDSKIHRKFLQYLSYLSEELLWCTSYSRKHFEESYWILLQPQIDNRIQTKGFEISDLKLQVDYHAIVTLLMGEKVYGDKRYGLRELVQNSIDACRVMAEEAATLEKYRYVPYIPSIQIILDNNTQNMIVLDNGIGMEYDVLTNYFLNIGKSYYKSDEFLYQGKTYHPIGTFGIGFLACFMLSDSVTVETKHYTEQEGYTIELEKDSEFVCKKNRCRYIADSGTAVILDLKSALDVFGQETNKIIEYLENTFLKQDVQIQFITIDDIREEETLKLNELKEQNPDGINLDSYLNGISAFWDIQFKNIKTARKFSELCDIFLIGEYIVAEYDYTNNNLCMKDLEGDNLNKYIKDNYLMVLKVEGIREEEQEYYSEWKKYNNNIESPPQKTIKTICFPIRDDEVWNNYIKNNAFTYDSNIGTWHTIYSPLKIDKIIPNCPDIYKILTDNNMLTSYVSVKLGKFSIIRLQSNRYIYVYPFSPFSIFLKTSEIYWHGILMNKGNIYPHLNIADINYGNCVINILRNDILPNVARDDLNHDEKETVKLAIEQAAYQYIIDNLTYDRELQTALQEFIDNQYPADNPFYSGRQS